MTIWRGQIRKMSTSLADESQAQYACRIGEDSLPLHTQVGSRIRLQWLGDIHCVFCGRATRKSFNQGYCFPCARSLARCDICIVKPELCHIAAGTCREPEWGQENCQIDHIVYLANTTGLKVGITRHVNVPSRWIDQGAGSVLPIARVSERLHAGLLEVALAQFVSDKSNWRALIKGAFSQADLPAERDRLRASIPDSFPFDVQWLDEDNIVQIHYPVAAYPPKAKSWNLDKEPLLDGILQGIRGQYLLIDDVAINIRKYAGYELEVELED